MPNLSDLFHQDVDIQSVNCHYFDFRSRRGVHRSVNPNLVTWVSPNLVTADRFICSELSKVRTEIQQSLKTSIRQVLPLTIFHHHEMLSRKFLYIKGRKKEGENGFNRRLYS